VKKLVVLGPPNTGKTSLLEVMFKGRPVEEVLELGLKATRGYERYEVNYLGLELVAFDHAGQDLSYWFENPERTFSSADIVVYMEQLDRDIRNMERVEWFAECVNHVSTYAPNAKLCLFINKMDRVKDRQSREAIGNDLKEFYGRLLEELGSRNSVGVYPVSLLDGSSVRVLGRLLNSIIPIGEALKKYCDSVFERVLKNKGNITIMDDSGLPVVESGSDLGEIMDGGISQFAAMWNRVFSALEGLVPSDEEIEYVMVSTEKTAYGMRPINPRRDLWVVLKTARMNLEEGMVKLALKQASKVVSRVKTLLGDVPPKQGEEKRNLFT